MTRRKRFAAVCILLVCSFCPVFARERTSQNAYKYNNWKEFYEYMSEAASVYNRVYIDIKDYCIGSDELTSYRGSIFGDETF